MMGVPTSNTRSSFLIGKVHPDLLNGVLTANGGSVMVSGSTFSDAQHGNGLPPAQGDQY